MSAVEEQSPPEMLSPRERRLSDVGLRLLSGHLGRSDARNFASVRGPSSKPQIPPRFITAEKGNMVKAEARWEDTKAWRQVNGVDSILTEPHPNFATIKACYSHAFHMRGRGPERCAVYYEKPGSVDWAALKAAKITMDDLMHHIIFNLEFLYTHIEPSDAAKTITVIDLAGLRDTASVMGFVKQVMGITSKHYPDRARYIYIVNVGWSFSVLFNVVSKILDPVTRDKIRILRGKNVVRDGLLQAIDASCLPVEYGGSCPVLLGQSQEEQALAEHVRGINRI